MNLNLANSQVTNPLKNDDDGIHRRAGEEQGAHQPSKMSDETARRAAPTCCEGGGRGEGHHGRISVTTDAWNLMDDDAWRRWHGRDLQLQYLYVLAPPKKHQAAFLDI
jgi:hypothetical protein